MVLLRTWHCIVSYHQLQKILQSQGYYQAIPAKVSQQKLKIIEGNWKRFLAENEVYEENPSKLTAAPRLV